MSFPPAYTTLLFQHSAFSQLKDIGDHALFSWSLRGGSGLCLRGGGYSVGHRQVQPVGQSEAGDASPAEETADGDGQEDPHWEAFHCHG